MKNIKKRFSISLVCGLLAIVLFSGTATAGEIVIRAGYAPYDTVPAAQNITVLDIPDLRNAAMTALAGKYRLANGLGSAPKGTRVNVFYSDNSSEIGAVVCIIGSMCVITVGGTQRRDDGTLIRGGEGGNNGGTSPGAPPPTPPGGGVVIVGPPTHEP